jgi:hypothetical protein
VVSIHAQASRSKARACAHARAQRHSFRPKAFEK